MKVNNKDKEVNGAGDHRRQDFVTKFYNSKNVSTLNCSTADEPFTRPSVYDALWL